MAARSCAGARPRHQDRPHGGAGRPGGVGGGAVPVERPRTKGEGRKKSVTFVLRRSSVQGQPKKAVEARPFGAAADVASLRGGALGARFLGRGCDSWGSS